MTKQVTHQLTIKLA